MVITFGEKTPIQCFAYSNWHPHPSSNILLWLNIPGVSWSIFSQYRASIIEPGQTRPAYDSISSWWWMWRPLIPAIGNNSNCCNSVSSSDSSNIRRVCSSASMVWWINWSQSWHSCLRHVLPFGGWQSSHSNWARWIVRLEFVSAASAPAANSTQCTQNPWPAIRFSSCRSKWLVSRRQRRWRAILLGWCSLIAHGWQIGVKSDSQSAHA